MSIFSKVACFTPMSSNTASMMMSASPRASYESVGVMSASLRSIASCARPPLFTVAA